MSLLIVFVNIGLYSSLAVDFSQRKRNMKM